MSGQPVRSYSDSRRVELSPRGDGVFVCTPCHGVRVFFPLDEARVGAHLTAPCPRDGRELLLELAADEQTESGLRPVWTDLEEEAGS